MPTITNHWSQDTIKLAEELHLGITIGERDWHTLKTNKRIRAAELISGALIKVIKGGDISETIALMNQAQKWLNEEIKDPGCPRK